MDTGGFGRVVGRHALAGEAEDERPSCRPPASRAHHRGMMPRPRVRHRPEGTSSPASPRPAAAGHAPRGGSSPSRVPSSRDRAPRRLFYPVWMRDLMLKGAS